MTKVSGEGQSQVGLGVRGVACKNEEKIQWFQWLTSHQTS